MEAGTVQFRRAGCKMHLNDDGERWVVPLKRDVTKQFWWDGHSTKYPQDLSPAGGTSWSLDSRTSVCIPGKGLKAERETQVVQHRWTVGYGEGLWSPWDRAGEGAEVGVLSPEGCAGINVTKNEVACQTCSSESSFWPQLVTQEGLY